MAGEHLIAYGRFTRDTKAVVVINNKTEYRNLSIPVWEIEVPVQAQMVRIMKTTKGGYNVGQVCTEVQDGMLNITMDPVSAVVYLWDNR